MSGQDAETVRTKTTDFDIGNILNNKYIYVLIALIGIGAFLRIYHLGFNSLWLDEVTTYVTAKKSFIDIWNAVWHPIAGGELNPPLFDWIEHFMLYLGNNEFILRFIPALAGIATIPLMYFIGKEISDRNVGIFAAALITFAPFHVYYSQEARTYSLLVFFIALAFFFLLKGINGQGTYTWLMMSISSSIAFWAHFCALIPAGIFFIIGFLYVINKYQKDIKKFFAAVLIFIVTALPSFLIMIKLFIIKGPPALTWGFKGMPLIYNSFLKMSNSNIIIMVFFIILFCLGTYTLWRQDKGKASLLVAIIIFSGLGSIYLSYKMPMDARYLVYVLPAYLAVIAVSLKFLLNFLKSRYLVYGFILLALVISIPYAVNYYTKFSKEDWRGVASYLETTAKTQDNVMLIPGYVAKPFRYYYEQSGKSKEIDLNTFTAGEMERIRNLSGNTTMYYVVTSHIYAANPQGDVLKWIWKNTKMVESFAGGIKVYKSSGL